MQNARKYQTILALMLLRPDSLRYTKIIICSVALFCCVFADAANVSDVAVGRVFIEDQSLATQKKAGKAALGQVFVKLSGSQNIINDATVKRAITNYEQYLIASSYLDREQGLFFEARFNQQKLTQLLKSIGLPVWANLRPSATLWFAGQDENADIQWFNQNSNPEFNQRLQNLSFSRGVNIVLPIGDLTDSISISEFDVWTQNMRKLIAQSTRYDTAFTISATLKPLSETARQTLQEQADFIAQQLALNQLFNASDEAEVTPPVVPTATQAYQLDWIVSDAQQVHINTVFVTDQDEAMSLLVNSYADRLAAQYATTAPRSNSLLQSRMRVKNVQSLADVNEVLFLLNEMPQVGEVKLSSIDGDTLSFLLEVNGSTDSLISLLTLDPRVSVYAQSLEGAITNSSSNGNDEQDNTLIWKQ
jgi:hypothetical protein